MFKLCRHGLGVHITVFLQADAASDLGEEQRTNAVEVWHGEVCAHACNVNCGSSRSWQALHQHTQVCCGPTCTAIQGPA